jgi:hypothetical protein
MAKIPPDASADARTCAHRVERSVSRKTSQTRREGLSNKKAMLRIGLASTVIQSGRTRTFIYFRQASRHALIEGSGPSLLAARV